MRVTAQRFTEILAEVQRQHPADALEAHVARAYYRVNALHPTPRMWKKVVRWACVGTALIAMSHFVHAQDAPNVNIYRIGGTKVTNPLHFACDSGCSGATSAGIQVRNAGDTAWVNVGFNVANLTLPVTLQAGSAVIGHVIADSGSTTTVTGNVAVTNSGLSNLDVLLSTRTKPADQQHAIIDSGTTVVTQGTGTNLHVVVDTAPTTAVTGTFFQTTQPISGTVQDSSALPAAQAGIIPVIVMSGPPPLSAQQQANPLLYRAAMRTYCYQSLSGCK